MSAWNEITVGDIAKKSALVWLHEVQEHEVMMRKSIAEWPTPTYQLAIHIQEAIIEAIHLAAGNGDGI